MKKRLNILIISESKNVVDGTQTNAELLLSKLERDGLEPNKNNFVYVVWSNVEGYEVIDKNIKMLRIKDDSIPVFRDLFQGRRLLAAVEKLGYRPDVIIVYDVRNLLNVHFLKKELGGTIAEFITNLPVSLSKTRQLPYLRSFYYYCIERFTRNVPDIVFVINETTKKYALKIGIPKNKINIFAPNVIKNEIPLAKVATKGKIRKKYSIIDEKKIVLSVGRLEKEKGFDILIKLFISMDDPSLVLIIVGEGRERSLLELLAHEQVLKGRIIFAGFVAHSEIWEYYKDADIFALLSLSEALGLVFWEAMYMDVPVLGARTGGIIETIGEKQERGIFWDKNDTKIQFRDKIYEAINGSERENRVLAAHQYVLGKISTPETSRILNDLLAESTKDMR